MTKPACKDCLFWNHMYDRKPAKKNNMLVFKNKKTGEEVLAPHWRALAEKLNYVRMQRPSVFDEWTMQMEDSPMKMYSECLDEKGRWGFCSGIPFQEDITVKYDRPMNKYYDEKHTNAVCTDGSGYAGSVRTLESFYCANFEKETS